MEDTKKEEVKENNTSKMKTLSPIKPLRMAEKV